MSPYRRKCILAPKHLQTKHDRGRIGKSRKNYKYRIHPIYPAILAIVLSAFITLYLCQSAQLIQVQYSIGQLKMQKAEILKENRQLKLAIEKLEDPTRIEMIAKSRLNMISPDRRIVISLTQPANTAVIEDFDR